MLSITVGRKMTINTGNYSSIQPSVSITAENIKPEDYKKTLEQLNTLVDAAFTVNTIEHADLMQLIKDHGLHKVLSAINMDGMKEEVDEALEILGK